MLYVNMYRIDGILCIELLDSNTKYVGTYLYAYSCWVNYILRLLYLCILFCEIQVYIASYYIIIYDLKHLKKKKNFL